MNGSPPAPLPLQHTPSNTNCAQTTRMLGSHDHCRQAAPAPWPRLMRTSTETTWLVDPAHRTLDHSARLDASPHLHWSGQHNDMLNGLDEHARLGLHQPNGADRLLLSAVLGALPIPVTKAPGSVHNHTPQHECHPPSRQCPYLLTIPGNHPSPHNVRRRPSTRTWAAPTPDLLPRLNPRNNSTAQHERQQTVNGTKTR